MLEVRGRQSGDYFNIECEKCGGPTDIEYKGLDPSVPLIKISCPKCNKKGMTYKLGSRTWKGFHPNPYMV